MESLNQLQAPRLNGQNKSTPGLTRTAESAAEKKGNFMVSSRILGRGSLDQAEGVLL